MCGRKTQLNFLAANVQLHRANSLGEEAGPPIELLAVAQAGGRNGEEVAIAVRAVDHWGNASLLATAPELVPAAVDVTATCGRESSPSPTVPLPLTIIKLPPVWIPAPPEMAADPPALVPELASPATKNTDPP